MSNNLIIQPETSYALIGFKPLTGDPQQSNINALIIDKGRITAIGQSDDIIDNHVVFDLNGLNLSPGFIDLQLNGCGGVLFNNDISTETLNVMHATNLLSGCTTFLPTLITSSDDDIRLAIDVVRQYQSEHPDRVPGIHLEGPYLSQARKGIHSLDYIRQPSTEMIDYICENADAIAMVTLAPEICPTGTIERLCEAGIIVSIGHTNATCEQVKSAEKSGARFVTHLHNAMRPLGSREPGVVGAVFDSEKFGAGIIADGYHLAWENLRIAHRLLQDRLVLVTDATTPAGTAIEEFEFSGQTITHQNGKCSNADGTLAGSALVMSDAVANSIRAGLAPHDVIRMASINAARAINIDHEMGSIAVGQYANLAFFDDNFTIQGTVSGGDIQFCHNVAM
jgi:N-acetylglucosamine-6-phosphate deacetylase